MRRRRSRRGANSADNSKDIENDLLFNCMGIFSLMMMVAMSMIGMPDVSQQVRQELEDRVKQMQAAMAQAQRQAQAQQSAARAAQQQLDQTRGELASAQQQKAQARRERDQARQKASDLEPKPVDLVIAIDGTSSMDPVLQSLKDASVSVAEIGSRLSPRFRIGIVVYRERGNTNILPLTEVGASSDGNPSRGMREVRSFVTTKDVTLTIVNDARGEKGGTPTGETRKATKMDSILSDADIEYGVSQAVAMLDRDPAAGTRKVLLVIGDCGPWEMGLSNAIESGDRQSASRTYQAIGGFTRRHEHARVLSLFSGKNIRGLENRQQTIGFFRGVASAAGKDGRYSDDVSQIAATVVEAVFAPND